MKWDRLAKIILAPVLIWQGLTIRRHALILPEADGPRSGQIGDDPRLKLLIVGDSSAAGVGVADQSSALAGCVTRALEHSTAVDWVLIARTGATTKSTLATLADAPAGAFDVALVALGVNDVTRGVSVKAFLRRQARLRQMLRTRFCAKRIVLTPVPPVGSFPALTPLLQWILGANADRLRNALADDLHDEADCILLDLDFPLEPEFIASDGFHPSARTYDVWGRIAAEAIIR